jgi:hypothetical protein
LACLALPSPSSGAMTAKAVVSEPMSGARRVGEAMTAIAVKPAMVPTAEPDDVRTRPDVPRARPVNAAR